MPTSHRPHQWYLNSKGIPPASRQLPWQYLLIHASEHALNNINIRVTNSNEGFKFLADLTLPSRIPKSKCRCLINTNFDHITSHDVTFNLKFTTYVTTLSNVKEFQNIWPEKMSQPYQTRQTKRKPWLKWLFQYYSTLKSMDGLVSFGRFQLQYLRASFQFFLQVLESWLPSSPT